MYVKLFVGNLPWSVGDAELEELFGDDVWRSPVLPFALAGSSDDAIFFSVDSGDLSAIRAVCWEPTPPNVWGVSALFRTSSVMIRNLPFAVALAIPD